MSGLRLAQPYHQRCRVPEDLSIVCLRADDIAKNLIRHLTSITFDTATTADWAAKALINQLEGRPAEVEQVVLPPQLIVRETLCRVLERLLTNDVLLKAIVESPRLTRERQMLVPVPLGHQSTGQLLPLLYRLLLRLSDRLRYVLSQT